MQLRNYSKSALGASMLCFLFAVLMYLTPISIDASIDSDGDGYSPDTIPLDCNDNDAAVFPGAFEVCDGKDNDCNDLVDDNCRIWKPVPLRSQEQLDAGLPGGEGMQMVRKISYSESDPEIMYLAVDTSQVWKSTDGGFSWVSRRNGIRSNGGVSVNIDPVNSDVAFVSGSNFKDKVYCSNPNNTCPRPVEGIYRTTDGGEQWILLKNTVYYGNKQGQHFVFDPRESDIACDLPDNKCRHMTVYAATNEDGLMKSVTGGDPVDTDNDGWTVLGLEGKQITDLEIYHYAPSWYNSADWTLRQEITIKSSMTVSDLADFPVLIKINDPANPVFVNALEDGHDILFTTLEGNKLDHEIESYNNDVGSEILEAWVRLPSLTSSGNTTIYMYYGNSGASVQENPQGVWTSNYIMVQHLNERPDEGTWGHLDSTLSQADCDAVNFQDGSGTTNATGQVGGADELDGINDYIDCGDVPVLKFNTSFTVEAWFNPDNWNDNVDTSKIIANKYDHDVYPRGWYLSRSWNPLDGMTFALYDGAGGSAIAYNKGNIQSMLHNWIHVAGVFKAGEYIKIYINGVQAGSAAYTYLTSFADADGYNLVLGKRSDANNYYTGLLDEVRISGIARDDGWINASYNNQHAYADHITHGSEEAYSAVMNYDAVIIYAATQQGLYKIVDDGDITIDSIGNDLPSYPRTIALNPQAFPHNNIIYAAVGTSKVYKSYDGGESFVSRSNGLTVGDKDYELIEISRADPDDLFVSVQMWGGLNPYYTEDGGETWHQPVDINEDNLHLTTGVYYSSPVAAHPTEVDTAFCTLGGGNIAKTVNGGMTWRYSGNGYMGGRRSTNKTSTYFDMGDPYRSVFFLVDFGPIITSDGGDTWEFIPIPRVDGVKTTEAGSVDPANPDVIITAIGGWSEQSMARSSDAGQSWTVFDGESGSWQYNDYDGNPHNAVHSTPDTAGNYQFIAFDPTDSNIIYAGMMHPNDREHGRTWISRDNGLTWENTEDKLVRAVAQDQTAGNVYLYAFEPCDGTVCSIYNAKVYYSIDKGQNWTQFSMLAPFRFRSVYDVDAMHYADGSFRLYAACQGGFWTFDGSVWTETGRADYLGERDKIPFEIYGTSEHFAAHNVVVDPNYPDTVYVGMWAPGDGQRKRYIYRSDDRGLTWKDIVGNLGDYSFPWALAVDPSNSVLHMSINHGNYVLCSDEDGDSYAFEGGMCGLNDCDDNDSSANPGHDEICDGKDNNCDGVTDEGFDDTDSDGIKDCVDPDDDNDGLTDGDEINIHNTDPLNPDTDSDGSNDGEEIQSGTLPLHPDTDRDGILDGQDIEPLNIFSPNPQGWKISKHSDFSTSDNGFSTTDTFHIIVWSNIANAEPMKKKEYKIKNTSGFVYKEDLAGTDLSLVYKENVALSGFSTGPYTVEVWLRDNNNVEYEQKDIIINIQ